MKYIAVMIIVAACVWALMIVQAAIVAGLFPRIKIWFTWKTVCSWCNPPRRTRGNPWAKNATHGMCKRCFKRVLREHAERDKQQRRVARAILAESLFRQRERNKANLKPSPPEAFIMLGHQHTLETRSYNADAIKLKLGPIPALSVPSAQSINPQRSTIN